MTKVLTVSEQYWPEGGGGILATHIITQILAQNGFQVTLMTGTNEPSHVNGVKYFKIPYLKPRNKAKLWCNLALLKRMSWFNKIIEQNDIVYIPRYCYPIVPLALNLRKKVIVHLHDYQPIAYSATILHTHRGGRYSTPFYTIRENVAFELVEHESFLRATVSPLLHPTVNAVQHWIKKAEVVCVSKRQAEIISQEMGINCKVLYNPLPETPPFAKNIATKSFLYTGGPSYIKGIQVWLRAAGKILRRNGSIRFILAGGQQSKWKKIIGGNPRLIPACWILGLVGHEEIWRLHSSSLALLYPSICEEPLPYAVSEAMLCRTVPIASRIGGVPEIVQGSFAEKMLFEPGNVDELVDRMESVAVIGNAQIEDIGLSLRESVLKRFDPQTTRSKLMQLFLA